MRVLSLSAALAVTLVLTGCGDSDSSTTDTAQADTTGGGDTQDDAVAGDTTATDTGVADTATAEDTATTEDTSVADTSTEDTTAADTTQVEDPAAETCPGIIACFNDNCVGLGLGEQQTCVNGCMAEGTAAEQQAVINLQTCVQTKNCVPPDTTDEDLRDAFECQRQCLPQIAVCFAGSFGDGACADVSGCVELCDESDILCQRDCYAAASEEQVQYYLDYNYCGLSQCYDSQDPIAQDTCLQQVIQQPACSDTYNQCFGSTGAGPGAGAGGGAE